MGRKTDGRVTEQLGSRLQQRPLSQETQKVICEVSVCHAFLVGGMLIIIGLKKPGEVSKETHELMAMKALLKMLCKHNVVTGYVWD